jgi:hypothetical protein
MHGGDPFANDRESAGARERRLVAETLPWRLYARTGAEWYDVTLKRAEHEHFSDRALFEPQSPTLIHPRAAHELINLVTLEFFDEHLRQAADAPWLSGRRPHPDLEIHRKGESP